MGFGHPKATWDEQRGWRITMRWTIGKIKAWHSRTRARLGDSLIPSLIHVRVPASIRG
jgi:hypothetical protein